MHHEHLIVISGSIAETRAFCRDTGITPRRIIHATPLSLHGVPALPVVRVGNWHKRRDLDHIERVLRLNARKVAHDDADHGRTVVVTRSQRTSLATTV